MWLRSITQDIKETCGISLEDDIQTTLYEVLYQALIRCKFRCQWLCQHRYDNVKVKMGEEEM